MLILYQEYNQTLFKSIFWGKMKRGVFQFWDQNHGLTPFRPFLSKSGKGKIFQIFLPKSCVNPFGTF